MEGGEGSSGSSSSFRRRGPPSRRLSDVHEEDFVGEGSLIVAEEGLGSQWPTGPRLRTDFAADWNGRDLLLDPRSHISYRTRRGMPLGNMRTFSGYSTVMYIYSSVLTPAAREILDTSAFGELIRHWAAIARSKPTANLLVLRAMIDRFWDTTVSFHLPGYEVGVTLTDFAMISGLPCGWEKMTWGHKAPNAGDAEVVRLIGDGVKIPKNRKSLTSFKTVWILDYFQGQGVKSPSEVGELQNARLWLWWFLGATYFGDKGERVSTSLLYYLSDWSKMEDYDWVSSGLGLTIKYLRDAVRPDVMDKGSMPSLVSPGIVMEAWILSHFPSLLPARFESPTTYPAVRGWGTCQRKGFNWTYDSVRRALNAMTLDKFVRDPWIGYAQRPVEVRERFGDLDRTRLYLESPFDSFWYLGERLAYQAGFGALVVPFDPPRCLFVQTPDPIQRVAFLEGQSDTLLLCEADYQSWAWTRLACGPVELDDPEMEFQPPDFPEEVEYVDVGARHTLRLPATVDTLMEDSGMESWAGKVKKVAGGVHKKIWRTANRWRAFAAACMTENCQLKRENAALKAELEESRRARRTRQS